MEPFMGFTSWAGFRAGIKERRDGWRGDLVLMQDEVSPVMDALFANGCTVTALHNHFAFDEPRVMFMHIGGEGSEEQLAKGRSRGPGCGKRPCGPKSSGCRVAVLRAGMCQPQTPSQLQSSMRSSSLTGRPKGAASNGMYKATFGREVSATCGCVMGKELGVNTWAAFCGSDGRPPRWLGTSSRSPANSSRSSSRSARPGSTWVAIHSHMEGETPGAIFLHYWGKGKADDLAKACKGGDGCPGRGRPTSEMVIGGPIVTLLSLLGAGSVGVAATNPAVGRRPTSPRPSWRARSHCRVCKGELITSHMTPTASALFIAALENSSLEVVDLGKGRGASRASPG